VSCDAVDLVQEVEDTHRVALGRSEHDRTGAVAEQHAGRAIGVVENARHHVGTDDERVFDRTGGDELATDGERIGEGRTRGADVEAPGVRGADLVLQQARRAREEHVGRDRADDDELDVARRQAGAPDRLEGGLLGQIGGADAGIDDVALADPGALQDPLVGGVDHLLEIVIGQHPRWHVGGQTLDLRPRDPRGPCQIRDGNRQNSPLPGAGRPKYS
jgi:hypothetical protein